MMQSDDPQLWTVSRSVVTFAVVFAVVVMLLAALAFVVWLVAA